jgi:hypothetical protein
MKNQKKYCKELGMVCRYQIILELGGIPTSLLFHPNPLTNTCWMVLNTVATFCYVNLSELALSRAIS